MKLKEKLAEDYVPNRETLYLRQLIEEAYLAGFEKAKELSLMPEHGYEGPFISGSCIEQLGEEEVGE